MWPEQVRLSSGLSDADEMVQRMLECVCRCGFALPGCIWIQTIVDQSTNDINRFLDLKKIPTNESDQAGKHQAAGGGRKVRFQNSIRLRE